MENTPKFRTEMQEVGLILNQMPDVTFDRLSHVFQNHPINEPEEPLEPCLKVSKKYTEGESVLF